MTSADVERHYGAEGLGERILAALAAAGKDPSSLTVDDLAPVDAFHIRGRAATEELLAWADVRPEHEVLDVGCGLGGTSRFLAARAGCRVVGVDLTEEYRRVAELLSERVGLARRTEFHQGSALALPFDDARFDVVWTEHVQMNVADKAAFYAELARVLRPGGQLAFHDVFAGVDVAGLAFPVPWAGDPAISHLIEVGELEPLLARSGLERLRWEDRTEASAAFFRGALARLAAEGPPPLGLHLLMGDTARTKLSNLLRNLEQGRLRVVQAVLRRGA